MPDLFDPLRGTHDRLVRPPLPADEVRRRGDRMRRRRTLTAATGATLAVVLVVGGGLALGGGLTSGAGPSPLPPATQAPSGSPEPTPPTGPDWRTGIPAGFPLARGLEDVVSSSEEELAGPGRDVRVFDVPFDACGRSTDLGAPVDTLAVRHTAPEWFDGRVLQVYGDDAAARAVLDELVGMYDACPKDLFEGPPDTVAVSTVRPVPLGEEGYLVIRTFSVDDLRVPGLELLYLVRVGNALLVTSLSNEGGASDASVARQLGEREPVIADVAAAMCTFAENRCEGDASRRDTGPLAAAVLGLDQVRELTRSMNTSWASVADQRPTLSCQPVPLSTLEPREEATAFFDGTGNSGVVNAQAAGAVLELPDVALAEQAFASVSGWLRDCAEEGAAARPVAIAHDPVTQKTGWGPATWRVVERPAPEICTECDTGWIDAQGVVLVGNRLALVSLAWTGDMGSGADAAGSPMNAAVETAARLAAGSAPTTEGPVFGPRGLGPVHLGMSAADVESSGAVLEDSHGQGCTTFAAEPEGNRVLGFLTENQGVSVLLVDEEGVLTPAGVGIGTTETRVRAAYPDAEVVPMGLLVPVPGFGDRQYTFAFEDGRLVEMALRLDPQTCVG